MLAVQFAQHLPQGRMLLIYGLLLVIGSVLAAAAAGPAMFIAGHVLQGLCTSLLLIAAAPPLFLGYPAARLRWSAMIMNMCLFGAVTAGPLIGGVQASFHAWRPLFWIVAGIAAAGLAMSLLTFQDAPPADRAAPRDPTALGLAAAGSVAAFWGASELITHRFLDPVAVVPLLAGLALIIGLWVYQYHAPRPLLTLRSLASTIPVTGVVVAICAAAASTSALGLTAAVLAPRYAPLHLGLLFVPELAGAVITSIVLFAVFTTRGIHYFVLAGMIFLTAGVLMLREVIPPSSAFTLAGSGLTGVGIGASVTPALFLAAFSLRSAGLQRVFAVLELLRGGCIPGRAGPAALRRHAGRPADRGDGHRLVDLLRRVGRRGAGRRRALPARRGTAVGPQGATVEGPRRFGLAVPAAASRGPPWPGPAGDGRGVGPPQHGPPAVAQSAVTGPAPWCSATTAPSWPGPRSPKPATSCLPTATRWW